MDSSKLGALLGLHDSLLPPIPGGGKWQWTGGRWEPVCGVISATADPNVNVLSCTCGRSQRLALPIRGNVWCGCGKHYIRFSTGFDPVTGSKVE